MVAHNITDLCEHPFDAASNLTGEGLEAALRIMPETVAVPDTIQFTTLFLSRHNSYANSITPVHNSIFIGWRNDSLQINNLRQI